MQITASRCKANKKASDWSDNVLTAYESGNMPKNVLLVCIHAPDKHPQHGGTTVAIDRTELVRFLRAVEACTEITD